MSKIVRAVALVLAIGAVTLTLTTTSAAAWWSVPRNYYRHHPHHRYPCCSRIVGNPRWDGEPCRFHQWGGEWTPPRPR
ncbi:MAG: hypothetical protein HYR72_15730 [Deltaproteobacteria bacterium]|nr:hypothetical protein [Deltaproteobacteria bacterium]MBI3387421.1 hypothetical protein [Deltaproteobacteria bacterium]